VTFSRERCYPALAERSRLNVDEEPTVHFYAMMFKAYLFTIAIETPVLLVGLSPRHSIARRLFCGVWLTACTYPFVWLVFPQFFDMQTQRVQYLIVAETFAPVGECAVFWLAFGTWLAHERHRMLPPLLQHLEHQVTGEEKLEIQTPPGIAAVPMTQSPGQLLELNLDSPSIRKTLRSAMWRDFVVITLANLASFGIGELAREMKWISFEADLPVE
jgi:hypothetical protein